MALDFAPINMNKVHAKAIHPVPMAMRGGLPKLMVAVLGR